MIWFVLGVLVGALIAFLLVLRLLDEMFAG